MCHAEHALVRHQRADFMHLDIKVLFIHQLDALVSCLKKKQY